MPFWISKLVNLEELDLSHNHQLKQLHPNLRLLSNLRTLNLAQNMLEPAYHTQSTLTEMAITSRTDSIYPPQLTSLILNHNAPLRSNCMLLDFSHTTQLTSLQLNALQLDSSTVGQILGAFSSLTSLEMKSNSLLTWLPPEIGNHTNLTNLNLSVNMSLR